MVRANRRAVGLLAVIASVVAVSLARDAAAVTVTQTSAPTADAYVNSKKPTSNFGTDKQLRIAANPAETTYLRFDVQGLSGSVVKATLRLTSSTASTVGYSVRAVSNSSWGETTISYNSAPPPSTTVSGSSGPFAAGSSVSVDVTSLVAGNGPFSVALTTTDTSALNLSSREAGSTVRPQL